MARRRCQRGSAGPSAVAAADWNATAATGVVGSMLVRGIIRTPGSDVRTSNRAVVPSGSRASIRTASAKVAHGTGPALPDTVSLSATAAISSSPDVAMATIASPAMTRAASAPSSASAAAAAIPSAIGNGTVRAPAPSAMASAPTAPISKPPVAAGAQMPSMPDPPISVRQSAGMTSSRAKRSVAARSKVSSISRRTPSAIIA